MSLFVISSREDNSECFKKQSQESKGGLGGDMGVGIFMAWVDLGCNFHQDHISSDISI